MEKALSLKTNRIVFAKDVNHEESKKLLPVCPECKEPVHLRKKSPQQAHPILHTTPLKSIRDECARYGF